MRFVIRSHINRTKATQFMDVLQQVLLVVRISSKPYEDFIGISHFVISLFVEFSERVAERDCAKRIQSSLTVIDLKKFLTGLFYRSKNTRNVQ